MYIIFTCVKLHDLVPKVTGEVVYYIRVIRLLWKKITLHLIWSAQKTGKVLNLSLETTAIFWQMINTTVKTMPLSVRGHSAKLPHVFFNSKTMSGFAENFSAPIIMAANGALCRHSCHLVYYRAKTICLVASIVIFVQLAQIFPRIDEKVVPVGQNLLSG